MIKLQNNIYISDEKNIESECIPLFAALKTLVNVGNYTVVSFTILEIQLYNIY